MPSEFIKDLIDHKEKVAALMRRGANSLFQRAILHDNSKFSDEEFDLYDQAFPEFKKYAFGSEEMKALYRKIQPALDHHFQKNTHHPEHFEKGVDDMNLLDLYEMICDWKAASSRSKTSIEEGFEINKKKFGIDDQLGNILLNTIRYMQETEE